MTGAARRYPDIWNCLAFLVPFAVYLWCLAPSITFYDSGEFITAVHFLGSAHSPGYPLFLLFAKPFTWLPFGNIAFRVNLATAVSAALACLAAYQLACAVLQDIPFTDDQAFSGFAQRMAALSAAWLFAVSPRLWLQSNHDKPYPLLTWAAGMMVVLLLRWSKAQARGDGQPAKLYAVAFLAGLASGAHQTIVLLLPGCLVFVLLTQPRVIRWGREWLLAAAFLLLGGGVQLYLPLRAAAGARQNWGDASALSRFLWHLLRRGYPEEPHTRDLPLLLKQLQAFSIPHEFGWAGFLLVIVGLWACWKTQRALLTLFLVSLASFWLVIAGYFNPVPENIFLTEEFYTPLYLFAAVCGCLGLYWLAAQGAEKAQAPEQYTMRHRFLLGGLFLLVPLAQLVQHLGTEDQHANYLAQDYADNSLRPLPEQAVLFTWGDSGAFPLWYQQGVEKLREDVDLVHIPHLVFPWYQRELPRLAAVFSSVGRASNAEAAFQEMVAQLSSQRPVLMDFSTRYSLPWSGQLPAQQGMLYWPATPYGGAADSKVWEQYALHRLKPNGWQPDADSEKALVIHAYCLMQAGEDLARRGHVQEAARLLDLSEQIQPSWQQSLLMMRQRYAVPGKKGEGK